MIGLIQKAFFAEGHEAQPMAASLFVRPDMEMGIQDFPFDLFIDESHGLDFKTSEHPLQDGSVITDHVTQQLRTCKISGMFTNHKMKDTLVGVDEVKIEGWEGAVMENVALKRYEALENLAKKRMPVRLVTSLVVYPKMIIKSIRADRTAKDGESIKFKMTLSEFKTVSLYEYSADKVYSNDSMDDDMSRLTAALKKAGRMSGESSSVDRMAKMVGFGQ